MNNRFMNMIRHTRVFGHVEDMIVQTHVVPRKSQDLKSIVLDITTCYRSLNGMKQLETS